MQNFLIRKLGLHKLDAKSVALLGIFTALSVLFSAFASIRIGTSTKISLTFVPIFILGALSGPMFAGTVSLLTELFSSLVSNGTPIIGMYATAFLSGFVFGIFFYNNYRMNVSYIIRLICCVLIQLFLSLVLNTYFLYSAGFLPQMQIAVASRAAASIAKMFAQIAVIAFAPKYLPVFSRIV